MELTTRTLLDTRARFIFRMDASPRIGVGHALRCVAIAEELQELGFQSVFVGNTDSIEWVNFLIDSIPRVERIESENEFTIQNDYDILVIDSYSLATKSHFIRNLPWKMTVAVVDASTPDYLVDVYIHPGPNYGWKLPENAKPISVLEGLNYVPIRRSITSIQTRDHISTSINVLTIVSGGTDPNKFIECFIPEIEQTKNDFEARIFTSQRHLTSKDRRISFHSPSDGIEKSFSESNIVITTAGTSVWEVASIGIPIGIAKAVENQSANFEYFTSSRLAIAIGQYENSSWKFEKENLELLLSSLDLRKTISENQKIVIKKNGLENIVLGLLKATTTKLKFEKSDNVNQ